MPYKNSQVAEYGDSFASWVEDDFSKFISSLITALPVSALTIVVPLFLLIHYSLISQVHHSESQASFVRKWLTSSSFKPVQPMFMHKIGMLSVLHLIIFQMRIPRSTCWRFRPSSASRLRQEYRRGKPATVFMLTHRDWSIKRGRTWCMYKPIANHSSMIRSAYLMII